MAVDPFDMKKIMKAFQGLPKPPGEGGAMEAPLIEPISDESISQPQSDKPDSARSTPQALTGSQIDELVRQLASVAAALEKFTATVSESRPADMKRDEPAVTQPLPDEPTRIEAPPLAGKPQKLEPTDEPTVDDRRLEPGPMESPGPLTVDDPQTVHTPPPDAESIERPEALSVPAAMEATQSVVASDLEQTQPTTTQIDPPAAAPSQDRTDAPPQAASAMSDPPSDSPGRQAQEDASDSLADAMRELGDRIQDAVEAITAGRQETDSSPEIPTAVPSGLDSDSPSQPQSPSLSEPAGPDKGGKAEELLEEILEELRESRLKAEDRGQSVRESMSMISEQIVALVAAVKEIDTNPTVGGP
jgi:hypothetical protein